MSFIYQETLKSDAFGLIEKGFFLTEDGQKTAAIRRCYAKNCLLKVLARLLAIREIKALQRLEALHLYSQLPRILTKSKDNHVRSYIEGKPLYCEPQNNAYFLECKKLLLKMRKTGVCNNDLAKEANWLVTQEGLPALIDFQLALFFKNRHNKLFLLFCYDDLRHLLKHKRKYGQITSLEKTTLQKKTIISRIWKQTGKRLHHFVTRKLLGWEERTGPEERDI